MCPPPDPAARDTASPRQAPARGHLPPPPVVGPSAGPKGREDNSRPAATTPVASSSAASREPTTLTTTVVADPEPTVVATPDRTVVTRRPRASHRPSEPHEMLPTLRLPPVEARALRRQAQAEPTPGAVEDEALALHSGEIELDPLEATPPPTEDVRDRQATVRVASVPVEPEATPSPASVRGAAGRARLHRPPLPLPNVLRNGPKPAHRNPPLPERRDAASTSPVPESIPIIDTASLVLEVAESLAPSTPPAAPTVDAEIAIAESPSATDAIVVAVEAPVQGAVVIAPQRERSPQPRSRWLVIAGVAASVALGVWWFAPAPRLSGEAVAGLGPLGEQLAFVATATPQPEPLVEASARPAAIEPAPAIEPLPVPDAEPVPAIVEPMGPLLADAALVPLAAPGPNAIEAAPAVAPSDATLAIAKPKPTAKPKPKQRRASSPEPKAAAAPPPPAPVAKSTASADPATLLRDAEKAFAEGRYATALRNAQRSLAARNDPRAARIVALSACKLRREDVARNAFARLPLGQRRGVRNTCKDAGIRL